MTRYPNSDCEKHRDVTTDVPICPVCMAETIDAQAAEIERLNKAWVDAVFFIKAFARAARDGKREVEG